MSSESIPLLLFIAVIIWLAIRFSRKFFSPENEDKAVDEHLNEARNDNAKHKPTVQEYKDYWGISRF